MELLVNDLSVEGQFHDTSTFIDAIDRIMRMRMLAKQFGRKLYCHRNMAFAQVTSDLTLMQVVQHHLKRDQQCAIMQWLKELGPFWDDESMQSGDDYLESNGDVVTSCAVGEAAWCCLHGVARDLVSFTPSSWGFSPIPVTWKLDDTWNRYIDVTNHWKIDDFETALRTAPTPLQTWEQLSELAISRCPNLFFSADCFDPLRGHPFNDGAADRIIALLDILDRLKCSTDDIGQRTPEGHRLYNTHFIGEKAWFTDSSESEKHDFRDELTFSHPENKGKALSCTWHGKVKSPQLRIHFSMPIRADKPLYIVYIGPKITKR